MVVVRVLRVPAPARQYVGQVFCPPKTLFAATEPLLAFFRPGAAWRSLARAVHVLLRGCPGSSGARRCRRRPALGAGTSKLINKSVFFVYVSNYYCSNILFPLGGGDGGGGVNTRAGRAGRAPFWHASASVERRSEVGVCGAGNGMCGRFVPGHPSLRRDEWPLDLPPLSIFRLRKFVPSAAAGAQWSLRLQF